MDEAISVPGDDCEETRELRAPSRHTFPPEPRRERRLGSRIRHSYRLPLAPCGSVRESFAGLPNRTPRLPAGEPAEHTTSAPLASGKPQPAWRWQRICAILSWLVGNLSLQDHRS